MSDNRFMNTAAAEASQIDLGLRSYMLGVYNHMTTALLMTGFFAYAMKWAVLNVAGVGQLMYGNDGQTPVEFQLDDGTKSTYPCSTDKWLYLNDGCLPAEQMDYLIADFRESQGERLKPKARRTDEENEQDYQLALWILENDVLSEKVLTDRDSWTKVGMACRGISDDLREPWLETCSRFDDGHYWRNWSYMDQNWERFSETSAITIRTLIHYANESDDQWRYLCPYLGKAQKQFISPCFQLLRSHKPDTNGFFNYPLTGYE